jgi:hypothetical protein
MGRGEIILMKRIRAMSTMVALTLLREWKATISLAIALYVAIPLVDFLESHRGSVTVYLTSNPASFGADIHGRLVIDH